MEPQKPSTELYYGILNEKSNAYEENYRHMMLHNYEKSHYHIAVGSKEGLREWETDLQGRGNLVRIKKISCLPEGMAEAMKRHYLDYPEKQHDSHVAPLGYIRFEVYDNKEGKVAFAEYYTPMEYYLKSRNEREKRGSGINASLLEAECLEHLRASAGATHITTISGYYESSCHRGGTNQNRRNQLIARGIDPMKTYPIGEWIARLRSVPDYSRVKNGLKAPEKAET